MKILRVAFQVGFIITLVFTLRSINTVAQSDPPIWKVGVQSAQIPKFVNRDNNTMLLLEITFENQSSSEQKFVVSKDLIKATASDDKPLPVLGLMWVMGDPGGSSGMKYLGVYKMEMMNVSDEKAPTFILAPGPVEITVPPGKTYMQRMLVSRPQAESFRLKVEKFADVQVTVPSGF